MFEELLKKALGLFKFKKDANYIEIYDDKGNRIKIDNVKFVKNKTKRNISKKDVIAMKKTALVSKETSKSLRKNNRKVLRELKGRK